MKRLIITGNPRPVIGRKEWYSVSSVEADWLITSSETIKNPLQPMKTEWGIMVQTRTGWKRARNDKEGETVPYTFGQKSLLHKGIRIVVRQGDREGELTVYPQRAKKPEISRVELLDVNYQPIPKGKKLSYRDTIIARAYCVEMFKMQVSFTLWEDDAKGAGHHPVINALNRINSIPVLGSVDLNGIAEAVFRLPAYTMAVHIANVRTAAGDRSEGALHEYYVTADVVSASAEKASPNINVVNPAYVLPPPRQRTWPVTVPVARPPAGNPKPVPGSPKFPVTTGGRSQSDGQRRILSAEFVDTGGNRLHASRVGTDVIIKITAKEMKNKKVQVKIWEEDTLTWTNDLLYEKEWILTGDENYIGARLTKKMFDKANDGGHDSRRQDYFIEVLYAETTVTSAVMEVTQDAMPTPVVKGKSVSVVEVIREEKKEKGKCPRCDKPVTPADLKTIFPQATDEKLKIVAETYTKYMKDLQMNTCWNKAHFFAQAKIESGDALSLKEGENFNYYWEALITKFKAFQTPEGREKAKIWGRAIKNRKDPKAIDVPKEIQIKIANYAYSPPAKKAKELGNTHIDDGWKYRGRGLIQVTGKAFYIYCNPYIEKYNKISVLQNPDVIGERLELSVSSGMIFFKWKSINILANKTRNVKDKICPLVGKDIVENGISKNHQLKQNVFDSITSKIFKIDECDINNIQNRILQTNNKWRHPIDNPMLCLYSQGGILKPWHGSFGERIRDGVANHTGCDLIATPGTNVYACVKSKIHKIYTSTSMAGKVVVLEVIDNETFKSLKRNAYMPKYKGKGEILEKGFNPNGKIYLTFWHLSKNDFFKEGDIVEPNDVIGLTGISGWKGKNFKTRNPHLHFEVSNIGSVSGLNGKCNPALYFHFKTETELSIDEINFQNKLKEKEWK